MASRFARAFARPAFTFPALAAAGAAGLYANRRAVADKKAAPAAPPAAAAGAPKAAPTALAASAGLDEKNFKPFK